MQGFTTEVRSTEIKTITTILSIYTRKSYPPLNPENRIMSIIPRNCIIVSKQSAFPELSNNRFFESQYPADAQLQATNELISCKDPELPT